VAGLLILAVLSLSAAVFFLVTESISDNVERVPDVFGPIDPATRPAPSGKSLTFLLVGTDSRSAEPTTGTAGAGADPGSQRSDVLMLARLNPGRTAATVASIPRDTWVDIPGHGPNKINSAFALGGPSLLVQTVENLTNIRVDHFAVIDFAGFRSIVDAVGGIDVALDVATSNDGVFFPSGVNHLDGERALAYVRQRIGLPDGDLDRAQRQQNALRALVSQVAEQGTLSSPAGTLSLLDAASMAVSVDDTLSNGGLRALASDLNGLGPDDITFLSAPVAGLGRIGRQSVVYLDNRRAQKLWAALATDTTSIYADQNPADVLGPVTR
jgi:LCP family protein required for cell wall assembly